MDPDHHDGFGELFRRDEESTSIDDIVTRLCKYQFFGVLAYRVSSGEPLSDADPKPQQSKDDCGHNDPPPGNG
jgi:hypothetical protein